MRRSRSADYRRAKTDDEKLWYSAGIPSQGWPKYDKPVDYHLIAELNINVNQQSKVHQQILSGELFDDPYLILLSSHDGDDTALRLAFEILKLALRNGHRVNLTNTSGYHPYYSHQDVDEEDESVQVLYNIHEDSGKDRVQLARDWIHNHSDVFRIVVTSGDPAVMEKLLRIEAHAMLLVSHKAKRRIQG